MQRQTFIDHMKERGYSISATINGNIRRPKRISRYDWRYGVHIDTPTVTAIAAKDATDAETLRIIDILTIQP